MKLLAAALLTFFAGPAATTQIGSPTFGLATGGGSVWVGGVGSGDLIRVDPASGKVLARVTVGFQPYDIEWGFGSAWVANAGDGTVWRITNGNVVKKIKIGTEPNGLTAYRGAVWVSDHTLGKVVRIDPATNKVTGTVRLAGADWIVGLGDSIYVSQETNRVSRISVRTFTVTGVAKVARNPLGSTFVGKQLWVPCIDANEVDIVDPATMRVVARKPVAGGPIVVLSAFGKKWVSQSTGTKLVRL